MASRRIQAAHRVATFVALVALATASLLVGTRARWPWWDVAISLTIAVVKAILVLWFFMDLAEQPFRARLTVSVAVLLVMLFVGLTATDVATRFHMPPAPRPAQAESFYQR
jgi:caa(3)-type oxidase subunit IV